MQTHSTYESLPEAVEEVNKLKKSECEIWEDLNSSRRCGGGTPLVDLVFISIERKKENTVLNYNAD